MRIGRSLNAVAWNWTDVIGKFCTNSSDTELNVYVSGTIEYFVVVDAEAPVTVDTAVTVNVWRGAAATGVPDSSYVLDPTDTNVIPVPNNEFAVIVRGV